MLYYSFICSLFTFIVLFFLFPLLLSLRLVGLFKLNTIRSEQCFIECCSDNIVKFERSFVAGSPYARK